MRCPRCDAESRERAKFCANCGARLVVVCPQCGAELSPDMRFCDQCGAELGPAPAAPAAAPEALTERLQRLVPKEYAERLLATRSQPHDERRTVTILFCDVKGSTAMAEKLDPEEVKEIINGAFEFFIPPVYRYEGTLTQLMGDAILAFFGAPIAHEDDPERAMRAALEITAGAKRYAARLERERGIKGFNVRVGVNTGLVVVGEVGSDLRVAYTAIGDAINLAARMEQNAPPGGILITEATHKLIAPLFETESLGRVEVKGKAEPVAVYRVLAAKDVAGKVRGIPGLESPLVGREAELAALQEALERLRDGVGGIVTLVGEAGIGKSRLVAEVRTDWLRGTLHQHRQAVLRWVEGRGLSYGTSITYLLWLDVLRSLLGVTLDDAPEVAHLRLRQQVEKLCPERFDEVYPYLGRLMALRLEDQITAKLDDIDGQALKAATVGAMETLIQCAASEQSLVLVCEDLHWADPASIELLERLLAVTDRAALLFICVFRPDPQHGSWRLREVAARQYRHRHTDLWLQPLSSIETHLLVGNLLKIQQLPAALKQRILDVAEGNPFYIEEIVRSLIDQQAIVRDEVTGIWQATASAVDIPIPDTLQGVLLARIDRLQEDTKRVLQMASVIGRLFLYRVLEAIAEEERRLDEHLLTLQREEMIRERARIPELEYIFKHELTREAAYSGLLKKERRAFHRQVAETLERLFPERIGEQLGLLAHHWEGAADADKAAEYLLRAGDQARLLYAHHVAIDYYERALVFLREQQQHERAARTLTKLGLTYHTAFDFARSREAYQQGFALWQQAGTVPAVDLPPSPHALRLAWPDPQNLDPATAIGTHAAAVLQQLFSGLVELTPEMDPVPDIARAWEVLEGGRTYVFHLRDDVRWSDGTPVTAEDFGFAWRRVLDPSVESPHAPLLYDVRGAQRFHVGQVAWQEVGVRALDACTLVVELEEATAYFLQLLDQPCTLSVPQHWVQRHGSAWADAENMVTNGPFRLERWSREQWLTLMRNPQYHGRFRGNIERVELSLGVDPSARLDMYESDRLDSLNLFRIPRLEMVRARQRHADEYLSVPRLHAIALAFNVRRPPFGDARVRRAFAMAVDREALTDTLFGDFAFPATGGYVPPGMPGHSPGIALPYDPVQARQLLAEAGYPPGDLREFPPVEWLGETEDEDPYGHMRAQWRDNLGVELEWELMEFHALWDRLRKRPPHIWTTGWVADYPDPDNVLRMGLPWEATGWRNEAYERLLQKARRVQDQPERMKLYQQADRILVQDAAITPMAYSRYHLLVKPWVRRLPISANKEWFWKDVVIEPH